jgi:hypothetical protein
MMNWKAFVSYYPSNFLKRLRKATKSLSQNSFVLYRDSKRLYHKYKSRALLTEPTFKNVNTEICNTVILPVLLYACETWSLMSREGHTLRVFESRVLRGIFWPKRLEVTGGRTELHEECDRLHLRWSCNGPWRAIRLWDVQAPTFFRQSAHRWRWSCQPYALAVLYPPGRFLAGP